MTSDKDKLILKCDKHEVDTVVWKSLTTRKICCKIIKNVLKGKLMTSINIIPHHFKFWSKQSSHSNDICKNDNILKKSTDHTLDKLPNLPKKKYGKAIIFTPD